MTLVLICSPVVSIKDSGKKKKTWLKLKFQSRKTCRNLLCIILCNFLSSSAYSQPLIQWRGLGDSKRAALFLLLQSWSGPVVASGKVIFWFLRCSLPCTCSFTTQFSINTPQLPLWLSQGLFTPSRPPRKQCRADTYRYISSYVCSSQFVKRLHNTACPHSRLATCVLICRLNRLVIQFKAKIITPPAQHCLPPLGLPVLNYIRWNWGEVHFKHLTLPLPLSVSTTTAVQRIQREKKSRSYLGSESSWPQFCSGCVLISSLTPSSPELVSSQLSFHL